jgi:signal transduction histidine kinase
VKAVILAGGKKVAQGDRPMVLQKLGDRTILDYVLALMEEEFMDKKIILERTGATNPFPVRGDRFQLTQALINIVNNAVEAMPQGGTLAVELGETLDPAAMEIRIRDSGQGILPENRKHLFAHFFTTKEKWVGLGLAITRKIIEGHGGSLALESEPDRGTTVIVRLPRPGRKTELDFSRERCQLIQFM